MGTKVKQKAEEKTRVGSDDFRTRFGEFIDRAWDGERIIVTRHEKEKAVLIGWRDYQKLLGA